MTLFSAQITSTLGQRSGCRRASEPYPRQRCSERDVPPADRTYLAQLVAAKAGIPLDHGNGRIRFASIG
jgi:hypothetical protein